MSDRVAEIDVGLFPALLGSTLHLGRR